MYNIFSRYKKKEKRERPRLSIVAYNPYFSYHRPIIINSTVKIIDPDDPVSSGKKSDLYIIMNAIFMSVLIVPT